MKKSIKRLCAVLVVLLIVYHVIVFAAPIAKGGVFWLSYVFTLVAFAVAAASVYIVFCKTPDVKSKFYGFPIARIGVLYALIQIIAGLLFMVVGFLVPIWIPLILYVVFFGVAAVGLISSEAVVEEIQRQDVKLKTDTTLMRGLQSQIGQLTAQCDNTDILTEVKKFSEELRYSDPVSSEGAAEAENELVAIIDELQKAVTDEDQDAAKLLCRKATRVLAERNRLCKLNKGSK